jgi:hypothetical protein
MEDYEMMDELLVDFRKATLFDICEVIQGNATKERAQDRMILEGS